MPGSKGTSWLPWNSQSYPRGTKTKKLISTTTSTPNQISVIINHIMDSTKFFVYFLPFIVVFGFVFGWMLGEHIASKHLSELNFNGIVTNTKLVLLDSFACADDGSCYEEFERFCTPTKVVFVCYQPFNRTTDCHIQEQHAYNSSSEAYISFGLDDYLVPIKETYRSGDFNFTHAFNIQCDLYQNGSNVVWWCLTL